MKKTYIVAALALQALSVQAATYYVVTPMQYKVASAPTPSIYANLNAADLPEGFVGLAYAYDMKQLLLVTGDANLDLAQTTWQVTTPLPDGLSLGAEGVLSGTPTIANPTGASFTVKATYKTASSENVYDIVVSLPITVALETAVLPAPSVGQNFSYDLKPLLTIANDDAPNPALSSWTAQTELPAGLTLSADGILKGIPTTAYPEGTSFTVKVTYKTATAQSSYSLTVNITISLAAATLTPANVGQEYTYDFKPLLTISGEASPDVSLSTWSASSMPAGLTLANNGVVSGVPSDVNQDGATVTVATSYKSISSSRSYTLVVNGVTLEVTAVSPGQNHTCAVTSSGGVKCWGYNNFGQLGTGTTTSSATPVSVIGLSSGVAAISSGAGHSCAVTTAGAVKCWGLNGYGQLGNGTTTNSPTPVTATGLSSGMAQVAGGLYHTCGITTAGAAKCWGQNTYGQLGDGTSTGRLTATAVTGLASGTSKISSGSNFSCALTGSAVKCWGYNTNGQLGDGTLASKTTPTLVSGLSNNTDVAAGYNHACALNSSGTVKCWGLNSSGQVGNGTTASPRSSPAAVSGLSGVTALMGSSNSSCAITSAGAAKCWGYNFNGQLGDGTVTNRSTPVQVVGLTSGVTGIGGRASHHCAMLSTGQVKCWGNNTYSKLGDGTTTHRSTPVSVNGF